MEVAFCVEALEQAIRHGQPEMFNTDQGVQFTRLTCTERLKNSGIRISMDGRGRALDNVLVERRWRSVKSEEVDLRAYQSVWDARQNWARYFGFYNEVRLHQALGYRTPAAVYLPCEVGSPQDGQLARERVGHREALKPNLYCPENGLDNGVHLNMLSLPSAAFGMGNI